MFKDRKGANFQKIGFLQRTSVFVTDHVRQLFASLGELYRTPLATFMTVGVLGISLTLPGVLYILVKNTESVTDSWQQAAEISLFLKHDVSSTEATQLVTRLSLRPEVADVKYISADNALKEFVLLSGLGDAIGYLESNPLPAVITVSPTQRHANPRAAETLLLELKKENAVESGSIDIEWLKRLNATMSFAKSIVYALALL
ncbi:MAG: permease-like cell division protein FtsX, partial [Pseudomonadota bacterium]